MCGIAGVISLRSERADPELVLRMLRWLGHRGPDEQGVWSHENVAMGTARLAIVDLAHGQQPLANEDQTVWVAFNGEIYNFGELRAELEAHAHVFRTRSDTEVIVHAYEQWGDEFLDHLKGMFAFSLVDTKRRRAFVARDLAGEKPLFYYRDQARLVFASEIKPLLHECGLATDIEPLALSSFFAFSRPVANLCAFRGVSKLPAAHLLHIDLTTGEVSERAHWRPDCRVRPMDAEQATLELRRLLRQAVRRFLEADVPVGAFLSGGTDSGGVVALMQQLGARPLHTFTTSYADAAISEAPEARALAQQLGTEHHEIRISPDQILPILPELIFRLEEPFGDASFLPAFFVARAARAHVKVALTGDGGDELFGGYDWCLAWKLLEAYKQLPSALQRLCAASLQQLPLQQVTGQPRLYQYLSGAKKLVRAAAEPDWLVAFQTLAGEAPLVDLLGAGAAQRLFDVRHAAGDAASTATDSLSRLLLFQFQGLLPELFFTKIDRMSMANSLECRSPLVDRDIVEFALSLPIDLKVRGTRRKYLLKRALEDVLPKAVLSRRKRGFSIPLQRWLREHAPLERALRHYVFGAGSRYCAELGVIDLNYAREVTAGYLRGEHNRWVVPWRLLCFGIWWESFVIGSGREPRMDFSQSGAT